MSEASQPAVETMRPFIPARDFSRSREFYEALGFDVTVVAPKLATVATSDGTRRFLLQDFYRKDLAENLMMQLVVPDIDAWWTHVGSLSLAERFAVEAPKPPAEEPWGMRVVYLWDPSGVLWHIASRI